MSQLTGYIAEQQALKFLEKQGLSLVTQNYRCRWGEIDLIMRDNKTLVFVEVRARSSITHGNALESITYHKQRKILKTALHHAVTHKQYHDYSSRFDVVAIQGTESAIVWLKDAFTADSLTYY